MAGKKLFRSAVGGYNKDDVKKYIEEIDIAATEAKQALESRIRELESENASLTEKLSELDELRTAKAEAAELSEKNKALEEEKSSLEASVIAQGEKLEEVQALLEKAVSENEALTAENASVLEKLTALEEQKAKEDEENANTIKNLLESARNEASALLTRAKDAAERIVTDAKEKAQRDSEKAKEESDELVKVNLEKVRYLHKKKTELADIFREHKAKVDSLFSTISDSFKGEGK